MTSLENLGPARRGSSVVEMVRVLDEDSRLRASLSQDSLELATAQALAPLMTVKPGRWSYELDQSEQRGHLGLLVLEGLLARHMSLGDLGSVEFIGPCALIRPWGRRRPFPHATEVRWEVLAEARLAVLDSDFALRVDAWPELVGALLERATERADSLLLHSALRQTVRVEDRLLLALWHFAGQWGEPTPEGRKLNVPKLTGAVLATIVGARRQSVSKALGQLADRQAIRRFPDGCWELIGPPPQAARLETGKRASDHVQLLHDNIAPQRRGSPSGHSHHDLPASLQRR